MNVGELRAALADFDRTDEVVIGVDGERITAVRRVIEAGEVVIIPEGEWT